MEVLFISELFLENCARCKGAPSSEQEVVAFLELIV